VPDYYIDVTAWCRRNPQRACGLPWRRNGRACYDRHMDDPGKKGREPRGTRGKPFWSGRRVSDL